MHIVFHTYNYLYSANHIHNPFDIYTGASCSRPVFFFIPLSFIFKKKKQLIWLSNVSALLRCQRCNLGNMKPIRPCKCIPLYHMCASRINFCMPSCVLNVAGGKRKALSVFQPAQLWQFSADIRRISAPVARRRGCGCTTLSGTIMRGWFQEDLCGISCMM